MSINIGFDSHRGHLFDSDRDSARLVVIAKAEHPDVLFLMEDRREVRAALAERIGNFPYSAYAGTDYRSVSVYSRYPVLNWRVQSTDYLDHIVTGTLMVPTAHGERKVFLVAAHPKSPLSHGRASQRKQALLRLQQRALEAGMPVVLLGDLNLTPQSPYFARLLKHGNLRDTAVSRAPEPTWLASIPGFGLRIDHVLVSPDIAVAARRVGPGFHSDHRPLTVDLVIPDAP